MKNEIEKDVNVNTPGFSESFSFHFDYGRFLLERRKPQTSEWRPLDFGFVYLFWFLATRQHYGVGCVAITELLLRKEHTVLLAKSF